MCLPKVYVDEQCKYPYNESSFSCEACIKFLDLKSLVCYVKKYHRKSNEITSSPKFTFIPIDVWTCKMN